MSTSATRSTSRYASTCHRRCGEVLDAADPARDLRQKGAALAEADRVRGGLAGQLGAPPRLGGAVLRPGEHRLALAAQDPAGNVAPSTREYTVTIRYVKLSQRRYVVRGRRLHVRVSTDATTVRWRLGGRSGKVSGRRAVHSLTLAVPRRAGRYRLAVTANGHRARATVVVRR